MYGGVASSSFLTLFVVRVTVVSNPKASISMSLKEYLKALLAATTLEDGKSIK